jgi:hypothetical protein
MITPESKMKFGKYKNKFISELPSSYIIELYKNLITTTIDDDKKEFVLYVETTLSDLLPKKNNNNINTFINEVVNKMCPKEFFINEGDAKYRLDHIRKTTIKHNRTNKIPIRVYECDRCGYWHLTSKPLYEYETENIIIEEEKEVYEPVLKEKWLKLMNSD